LAGVRPLDSLLVEILFVALLVLAALGIAVAAGLAIYVLARTSA